MLLAATLEQHLDRFHGLFGLAWVEIYSVLRPLLAGLVVMQLALPGRNLHSMVIQLVRVSIRPEQRDRWLELIRENAAQTRSERGCESYEVGEDLEGPNTFSIVERWSSLDAQYDHFRNPQFGQLMGALGDVLAEPPEVSINEVSSTLTLDEALANAGLTE